MDLQVNASPRYEIRPKHRREGLVIVAASFTIAEALIFLLLGKEGWSIYALVVLPISIVTALAFLVLSRATENSKNILVQFVNSISNTLISWALEGPSLTGKYRAHCELSSGYYASLKQGLSYHLGYKAILLSVSKFIKGPEQVSDAPFFKWGWDNRTLKLNVLPFENGQIESWKKSKEKWKQLVAEDEVIRSWMAQNCDWRNLRYAPSARGIYSVSMLAYYGYQRNPSVRNGWLKGSWLTVDFIFRTPTSFDTKRLSGFYVDILGVGQRIIQHIEEGTAVP